MTKKVQIYYSSATSTLKVKKEFQSMQFLLQKKKAQFEEVDMAQMGKEDRDRIYETAKTRTLPLLFVDDQFVGDYETVEGLEEEEKLNPVLGL
eukprot:TRINITY_DN681_c0_g2_i1.p1 TRINITY_DN681_c0_g2~~TRINITY_DN681_c0_g2_i1.p1  ORF type:complete len:109 (-),score=47.11 TRINITY_DN681_c0_g2_i1:102-380(-)